MTTKSKHQPSKANEEEPYYYKLDYGNLPDKLFGSKIPAETWLNTTTTVGRKNGFPANSLNKLSPIPRDVELERIFGIALYMIGNVIPFLLPILLITSIFSILARYVLLFVIAYFTVLLLIAKYYTPHFIKKYKLSKTFSPSNMKDNQYVFTERNSCKYLSLNVVWPKSVHRPALESKAVIFAAIPHGVCPFGVVAYPLWSKVWNDKLCHWTTAPVVLKLPIVSGLLKALGYIPAKTKSIMDTLTKKEENVGIILDGIAGMFQRNKNDEVAKIMARKGIVKIALRAGVPIVPIYGFGHTSLYTVIVDPFGLLEYLSIRLDTALTPFFGRYGWFLGPPSRSPVTVCLGEPINCPLIAEPTKDDIEKYHNLMLDSYKELFDQHKAAFGWENKNLKFS